MGFRAEDIPVHFDRQLENEEPALKLGRAGIGLPLAIAAFWSCCFAQEPLGRPEEDHALSYGAEADFSSGYVWRGLLLNDGPVVQPSAWISRFGLTFYVWSNLPLTRTSDSAHLNATILTLPTIQENCINWLNSCLAPESGSAVLCCRVLVMVPMPKGQDGHDL